MVERSSLRVRVLAARRAVVALSAVAGRVAVMAGSGGAAPGDTNRVSVSSSGAQANDGSYGTSTSADGRFVAFESWASNLVAGDTNRVPDIFVRDRRTGTTERVSVSSSGGALTYAPPLLS